MDVRELPVDELVLDATLNLRDRLDQDTIERYDDAWDRLPPIGVFEVEGRWLVVDGFHRHASALRLGKRTIPAEVQVGTMTDALDHAAMANLAHGLPLTRAERRRVVETRLRIHPDWSDRRLAEEMGLGRELIARVRKQLVDAGQLPASTTRVGADGKTYPSAGLPRDPNEHRPRDRTGGGPDDPRDRGGSEADAAPWASGHDPMPTAPRGRDSVSGASFEGSGAFPSPPWDDASAKVVALGPPVAPAAPSIDEMLGWMTNQIHELIAYTEEPDFLAIYPMADAGVRGMFENAALQLGGCLKRLRRN